jgi:site-specific DNA recombinase
MTSLQLPKRVAKYLRVSTTRQAEADLSLPDQDRQIDAFCMQKQWLVAASYVEAGATATDDRRPEFQRMVDTALGPDRPFDVIVVHSMSRFFRDQFQSEFYIRKLREAGVQVVSITQQFESDPTGELIRKIIGNFDEYQSRENAKHTLRAMRENARQHFWNGSVPPFGYATEAAERRGVRVKKRLVVEEAEARIVRSVYDLSLGCAGPALGVKAIAVRLNGQGLRFRGKPFHISNVHRILTSPTYAGTHSFNRRDSRTGQAKPADEWVTFTVPAIVPTEVFKKVQAVLAARSPKRTPPRVASGPILLTGPAQCGTCGSGMTIRTGKSGRYRYYTCAGCAQKGPTVCPGRSISMAALDGMVMEHLADRLLTPERLVKLLEAYIARSSEAEASFRQRLGMARQRATEVQAKITRLLQMVADGLMDQNDPQLKEMLLGLKAQRTQAEEDIALLEAGRSTTASGITPARIERCGRLMRSALSNGDLAFRKAYLRLFVDCVVVSDTETRILGPKVSLAKMAVLGSLPPTADMVPRFVREWRAGCDDTGHWETTVPLKRRSRSVPAVSAASRRGAGNRGW